MKKKNKTNDLDRKLEYVLLNQVDITYTLKNKTRDSQNVQVTP